MSAAPGKRPASWLPSKVPSERLAVWVPVFLAAWPVLSVDAGEHLAAQLPVLSVAPGKLFVARLPVFLTTGPGFDFVVVAPWPVVVAPSFSC